MSLLQRVRDSCEECLKQSHFVHLASEESLQEAADKLRPVTKFDPFKSWSDAGYPTVWNARTIDWIFVSDLLNFSFWSDERRGAGYGQLIEALQRYPQLSTPCEYIQMQYSEFCACFEGAGLPMMQERYEILQHAGRILCQLFEGSFANFLQKFAHGDSFLPALLEYFPSFQDVSPPVWLLKRAQILVADLWTASGGHCLVYLVPNLTVFADYRIPQVLWYLGVLEYSDALISKLRSHELLPNSQSPEVDIRAAAVVAGERLKRILSVSAVQLDYYLWNLCQSIKKDLDGDFPFHRTRCIYY